MYFFVSSKISIMDNAFSWCFLSKDFATVFQAKCKA